ncbi:glycosyltransferase family 2 protein [Epibacterium sp. Ofav1-8]|uniref:glycosyltransferase family 2 protein n=1 Tax=Epibacterium sp. Ofav1-8 TaxID=2917735 RepID=UPI001EF64EC0|nr:glycosyltransferase family 2 protein [Epibacterium sp. Ofav1-8]MCG7625977.1 glycosyltransferase [Epibacterium sp. Ofav1-8]
MQHSMPPVVSVIMPVYNAEVTLEQAVASVRAQCFQAWELLLIEDGSQDGSAEVCARLTRQDERIRLLRQPGNTGAAAARNAGLAAARGRYIAFLDADDRWLENKLQRQITFMQETGTVFAYSGFWRARGSERHQVRVPERVTRAALLRGNVIGCLTAIYDREYFGALQMPLLRMRQDFAFWLLLLERCEEARGIDEPLAIYHVHQHSLTAGRGRAMQATWHMYRTHLGLPAWQAVWYMSSHLIRRFLRG